MYFGLQKLTLLDYPGKVACTVFSAGCNFRCPFCHNGSLVKGSGTLPFSFEEVESFLKKRAGVLDGVCFTGGEPLLNDAVMDLAKTAKFLGYAVKLDTNGSFPEKLRRAVNAGLVDYVAMDIKSTIERYHLLCGNADVVDKVCESVDLLKSRICDFEFRTTVVGNLHRPEDFARIGKWIAPAQKYFLQPYKDSGDVLDQEHAEMFAVSDAILQECLLAAREFVPQTAIRGR